MRHHVPVVSLAGVVLLLTLGCGGHGNESGVCGSDLDAPPSAFASVSLAAALDVTRVEVTRDPVCLFEPAGASCWGFNAASLPDDVVQVASTARTHCVLVRDGTVTCEPYDNFGPVPVVPPAVPFARISMGGLGSACGIRASDGGISCWGDANWWKPPEGSFARIELGSSHGCALTTAGEVRCFGGGTACETDAPLGNFTQITMGSSSSGSTCGLRGDGARVCWGNVDPTSAVQTLPSGTRQIASGGLGEQCALLPDGSLACEGSFLGKGVPTGTYSAISGASSRACALRSDGVPVCWGLRVGTDAMPWNPMPAPAGFTVDLEGRSFVFPAAPEVHEAPGYRRWEAFVTDPPEAYTVEVIDVPADIAAQGTDAVLEFGQAAKVLGFPDGKLSRTAPLRWRSLPGREVVVDVPLGSATSVSHVYAEGARLWVLTVVMQTTKARYDERSAFLDAFVR